jgi:DNA-binding MarR family transcriptional regulator
MAREAQQVADLLHSASIHLLRRASEQDRTAGLSAARLSTLSAVVYRGPLTLGKLAAAEAVRSATMSGIVNGLEAEGLVRRRPHTRDGRAVLIEATAKGRRMLGRARAQRVDLVAAKLEGVSERDLDLLWRAAEILEEHFALQPWRPVER